ncbi:hypothetical protein H7J07_04810 [Mycobacterium koreense]|uniref:hypothetical protein n=1 Tax=Mycolicibacillus koreensis TaxID=1069220 RepID=UPI0013D11D44|nr:hypothetical protein [Mycolicibacillus koreensis]MCV7247578.1 hypothetical protein [Mycolicibacillus koreensis]
MSANITAAGTCTWGHNVTCSRCGVRRWHVVSGAWTCTNCNKPMNIAEVRSYHDSLEGR